MNKGIFRYFYVVVVLLNTMFSFAKISEETAYTLNLSNNVPLEIFETSTTEFKQNLFDFEVIEDSIVITESEIEEEAASNDSFNKRFNFFSTYFVLGISKNQFSCSQNKLSYSKYIAYLSSLTSRNISYCVYRL
jgi:hypothetical protein